MNIKTLEGESDYLFKISYNQDPKSSNFENLFESYGFPKETLVFKPHITIARIKYPQKFEPNLNTFLNSRFDPIEFPVNRVQFLTSELLPSGVVYTLIKSFPLGEE